jgi:tRNA modification GTPase
MLPRHHEPIVAQATATGRGAVGIVRLSGRQLLPLARALTGLSLRPRHAHLAAFNDAQGRLIDRGLAIHFPAPHSYTGEDVLELHAHGGAAVLRLLMARCLELGASRGLRLAQPGEFTLRAFLNGKIDLAQAEAVSDLIDAATDAGVRSASRSLDGAFSRAVDALSAQLIELRALIEATLDFPEEEVETLKRHEVRKRVLDAVGGIDATLRQARQGRLLRDGLTVVLAGQPNVGKSSLLNCLAGADVAIVTAVPGTTRDRIAQTVQIDGVPVHIIDTAGLRDEAATQDEVERIGMRRSWEAIKTADAVIFLHDLTAAGDAEHARRDAHIEHTLRQRGVDVAARVIHVHNKADKADKALAGALLPGHTDTQDLYVSALTGEGVEPLRQALLQRAGWAAQPEGTFMARARHVKALQEAKVHLMLAMPHTDLQAPALELLAEELKLAHQALASITGDFTADDLLGSIFERFCIGK